MNYFVDFFRHLFQVLIISTAFWYVATRILQNELPHFVVKYSFGIASAITISALSINGLILYPLFRSPLNKFPVVKV